MNHLRFVPALFLASTLGCATAAEAARSGAVANPGSAPGTLSIAVDLREAPRRLLKAHLVIPVRPGPLALVYPKWIPGEHGPTGPVVDLGGLVFKAGGAQLSWERDPVDLYKVRVVIPAGASELGVDLQFYGPPPGSAGFSGGASSDPAIAILSWNQVVLYPEGADPRALQVAPSLVLPQGWKLATALEVKGEDAGATSFAPVSLEQLIDSTVLAGAHLVRVPVGDFHGAKVFVDLAAETEAELRFTQAQKAEWEALVREEAALFGARHFNHYDFLLTLSDSVAHFGLEHHQSSDDRVAGRALLDRELEITSIGHLLAHESVHSWNGKYRRPAGLATADYQQPMQGQLLWVYEGLTQYLGSLLTGRMGAWNLQTSLDYYALIADQLRNTGGRAWRPLQDTATAAQLLYAARGDWSLTRRGVDFYSEGDLVWMEADAFIREATKGEKSLDDFCRLFHGGKDTAPEVVPYTLADVTAALGKIAPNDWQAFFAARFQGPTRDAPLAGLERAGWKLEYLPVKSDYQRATEKSGQRLDESSTIGVYLDDDKDRGVILDLVPGRAADLAGLGPRMKIEGVNGRRYTPERLATAIAETARGTPLTLLVENAETFLTFQLDYRDGLRYPHLARIEGRPDLLTAMLAPRAAKAK